MDIKHNFRDLQCVYHKEIKTSFEITIIFIGLTGSCIFSSHKYMDWFPRLVRYVSVCGLQSAGTTEAGLLGYTADSRQITTDLPVRG
jgi:hypothetical protein